MWVNQIFSLIKPEDDQNVIQNIIVCDNYTTANDIAKGFYGEGAYAVDTTHFPVSIGCVHTDDNFYKIIFDDEGVESERVLIPRNPTQEELISMLMEENNMLKHKLENVENDNLTAFEAIAGLYEIL